MAEDVLSCSVGIMAYNEEDSIGDFLNSLLMQRLKKVRIEEIIVIASGCTDRTEEIVKGFVKIYPQIRLISQPKREGKASAINLFLQQAKSAILVESSADILLREDTIENLVTPFLCADIGMAGVHSIPLDRPNTFMGFTVNLLWELHHQISLDTPKLGEMIAFRKTSEEIPCDTAVDEATIEVMIIKNGYRLHYAADAIIYNRGAKSVRDFLIQRRRIHAGHLWLQKQFRYRVATKNFSKIFELIFDYLKLNPQYIFWTLGAAFLEFYGWLLGNIDFYIKKKNPFIWERIKISESN